MSKIKRQGRVIIYRIITPEYEVPLGVWTVRETISDTIENATKETKQFESKDEILSELKKNLLIKGVRQADEVISESVILKEVQTGIPRWTK